MLGLGVSVFSQDLWHAIVLYGVVAGKKYFLILYILLLLHHMDQACTLSKYIHVHKYGVQA